MTQDKYSAPWCVFIDTPDYGIGYRGIIDADGFTVCNPSPMGDDNARLIAAAPDLLEALYQILELPEGSRIAYKIARKAIAKVTRGQNADN